MVFLSLPPLAIISVRSASEAFLALSETRLGILAAGFPARSAPWQAAHFALYMAAPSSAAHDRLGRTRNSATAIIAIRITSFVIFMIAFPFQNLSCLGCSSALKLGNLADEFRDWIRTYRVSTDNGVSVSDCGHGGS